MTSTQHAYESKTVCQSASNFRALQWEKLFFVYTRQPGLRLPGWRTVPPLISSSASSAALRRSSRLNRVLHKKNVADFWTLEHTNRQISSDCDSFLWYRQERMLQSCSVQSWFSSLVLKQPSLTRTWTGIAKLPNTIENSFGCLYRPFLFLW